MNRTEYIGKLNALYVGDKNCLEELITAYDEKDKEIERLQKENQILMNSMVTEAHTKETKEIERLNKRIEDLNIINEEHRELNGMIRKELQKKENIIKEVREHFKELIKYYNGEIGEETTYLYIHIGMINDVLEILDKENKQ